MRQLLLTGKLDLLYHTMYFLRRNFMVLTVLGLVAAFGRVIQLGGFGQITEWGNIVLEVVVESARIMIFLYVLGMASVKGGFLRIRRLFTEQHSRKLNLAAASQKCKRHWPGVILNFMGFLLIAAGINYMIDLLAYETCFYLSLKKSGILADASSEWTVLLFFKNLSVIPFTLAFEALFLLWITDKVHRQTPPEMI